MRFLLPALNNNSVAIVTFFRGFGDGFLGNPNKNDSYKTVMLGAAENHQIMIIFFLLFCKKEDERSKKCENRHQLGSSSTQNIKS
jgi:hypothetical protein